MVSGNDFRNSQALRRRQKIICDDDDVISSGRAFQKRGPATDWYPQSAASVDRADLTQARGVRGTGAHFRGGLCSVHQFQQTIPTCRHLDVRS